MSFSTSLSGTLLESGLLTEPQLAEVQRFQANLGGSLRQAVMKLGLLREHDLLDVYEKILGIERIERSATAIPSLDDHGGNLVNQPGRRMWNPHTLKREPYDIDKLSAYIMEMRQLDKSEEII